jgi:hypothetical protein
MPRIKSWRDGHFVRDVKMGTVYFQHVIGLSGIGSSDVCLSDIGYARTSLALQKSGKAERGVGNPRLFAQPSTTRTAWSRS